MAGTERRYAGSLRTRCQRAVTLVEALVASIIFLMAAMGAFGHFHYARSRLNLQSHRRTAAEIAQSRMEEMRTVSFDQLPDYAELATEVTIDNISGSRDTAVDDIDEDEDSTADFRRITVTLSWIENGNDHQVELLTLVAEPPPESEPPATETCLAVAYVQDSSGLLKTMVVNDDGSISNAVIDSLVFQPSNCSTPSLAHITGDVYAVVYCWNGDGIIKTVRIGTSGTLADAPDDTFTFETGLADKPRMVHVSGQTYAIAFCGPDSDGFIKTVTIGSDGQIGDSVLDSLEFDTLMGCEPSIIHVAGNVYAVAYRGNYNRGTVKTIQIQPDGEIADTVIDQFQFDAVEASDPLLFQVAGDVYGVAYSGSGDDGYLATFGVSSDGQIADAVIDSEEFNASRGIRPRIAHVTGEVYAVAYEGPFADGFVETRAIAADGAIADNAIDIFEFDTLSGLDSDLIHVRDDIYAVAYSFSQGATGVNDRGYLVSVRIDTSGQIQDSIVDSLEFDGQMITLPDLIKVEEPADEGVQVQEWGEE